VRIYARLHRICASRNKVSVVSTEHRWTPWPLPRAVVAFEGAPFRWWIGGGHALELHAQRSWREHGDIDVGICRGDIAAAAERLREHRLFVASSGRLLAYHGQPLEAPAHQNNVWIRESDLGHWVLDLTLGEGDAHEWVYRRDPTIRRDWDKAVLRSAGGIPYLAPDLQLLFKSARPRSKDDVDFAQMLPQLCHHELAFLGNALPGAHPWRALVLERIGALDSCGLG